MEDVVDAYTDGACSGNPGPGGWAVLLRWQGKEKELTGGEVLTTNNRMELTAAIQALDGLKRASVVRIHTDSKYVMDGITTWIKGWKKNGWKTSGKNPVKNVDLWQKLDALVATHDVKWLWVKGHSGHSENDRVDRLAVETARKFAAR